MDKRHISSQFDADLNNISTKVVSMGNMVQTQVHIAMRALESGDNILIQLVMQQEEKVNEWEVEIDALCSTIITRRQPTAGDLRLLMAVSKIVTNLERAGDEAEKIAKRSRNLIAEHQVTIIDIDKLMHEAELVSALLAKTLNAFQRHDASKAKEVIAGDQAVDLEFNNISETIMALVTENAESVAASMDLLFIAKALERIGDHAKNIAELIIYMVEGIDIRHASRG